MTYRILGSVIVLISIFTLPFWIYIPVLFVAVILLPYFWEGILFAFLIDTVYGGGTEIIPSLISPLALSVLFVLIILLPFRESLRSYV